MISSSNDAAVKLLRTLATYRFAHYPILLCLVTGIDIPSFCVPMRRIPVPPTGMQLDENFGQCYADMVTTAPSLHDGALILSRRSIDKIYHVSGWSYRLIPPYQAEGVEANRGSAYNSAIAMSLVDSVDLVALVWAGEIELYVQGRIHNNS